MAPEHNALGALDIRIETEALAALVNYMLETYPALDPTRVYATGYSMGGGSTMKAILSSPDLFAAAVPMSPVTFFGEVWVPSEEELAQFANIDLPVMLTASGADLPFTYDSVNDRILCRALSIRCSASTRCLPSKPSTLRPIHSAVSGPTGW